MCCTLRLLTQDPADGCLHRLVSSSLSRGNVVASHFQTRILRYPCSYRAVSHENAPPARLPTHHLDILSTCLAVPCTGIPTCQTCQLIFALWLGRDPYRLSRRQRWRGRRQPLQQQTRGRLLRCALLMKGTVGISTLSHLRSRNKDKSPPSQSNVFVGRATGAQKDL